MEAIPLRIILRFSSCNISYAVHKDTIYHMKSFAYLRDIGFACAWILPSWVALNSETQDTESITLLVFHLYVNVLWITKCQCKCLSSSKRYPARCSRRGEWSKVSDPRDPNPAVNISLIILTHHVSATFTAWILNLPWISLMKDYKQIFSLSVLLRTALLTQTVWLL